MCVGSSSSVIIYILSEPMRGRGREGVLDHQTYKDWSDEHSLLTSTVVSSYQLPSQETVQQLDTQLVQGRPFLCVSTSSYRLVVFELPTRPGLWQAVPVLDKCLTGIHCAKLRQVDHPYLYVFLCDQQCVSPCTFLCQHSCAMQSVCSWPSDGGHRDRCCLYLRASSQACSGHN